MTEATASPPSKPCQQCGVPLPAQARFCGVYGAQQPLAPAPPTPEQRDSTSTTAASPLTVFISYSRADGDFVTRLRADLRAQGIHFWIDTEGITPGTPDWEEALRRAIRKAGAVVLVASPHSRQSLYVKDELRVAAMYGRPVYPIWALGEDWIDAIPLGLGGTQYLDARGAAYPTGVQQLVDALCTAPLQPGPLSGSIPVPVQTPAPAFEPRNPYKGLRAFSAQDAQDFFGRAALIAELLDGVKATLEAEQRQQTGGRLLAILGPSGAGKSSVLLAGLLPRLQAGALSDSRAWVYLAPMTPGVHPLESLALAFYQPMPERSLKPLPGHHRFRLGRMARCPSRPIPQDAPHPT